MVGHNCPSNMQNVTPITVCVFLSFKVIRNEIFKWRTSRAPRTSAVQHFISEVISYQDNVQVENVYEGEGYNLDNVQV